jgi:hypothetical protein
VSQENVEVVRRAFAYLFHEGGDRAEAEAIFDPHVVMNPVEEAPLYGVDAIRQNFERWRDAWEELEVAAAGRLSEKMSSPRGPKPSKP